MARPRKKLDPVLIEKLASVGNPVTAIATILGCSPDTLQRRFAAVIKKGRENANNSLRIKQFQLAMGGNVTMLIWLGKQLLGQSDKVEAKTDLTQHMKTPEEVAREVRAAHAERHREHLGSPESGGPAGYPFPALGHDVPVG
ncbi:MAG: hypothetical protein ABSH10_02695 [Phycisphaerae bacterium]|jgi:hypothetical protein